MANKRRKAQKHGFTRVLRRLLAVAAMVAAALFLGERLGLLPLDWNTVYERGNVLVKECVSKLYRPLKPAVEPVSGEGYAIYFTTPRYPDHPATRVHVIEDGLRAAIGNARKSLDLAIYQLDLDSIGDAILSARDRGVAVRMVTDSDSFAEGETLKRLRREGIPIVPDGRSAIMHNKFVVIDAQAVWTGSWNLTENGTFRHNNNAIVLQSKALAQTYIDEFEEMFSRRKFGPASPHTNTRAQLVRLGDTVIEPCFAPEDGCAARIVDVLRDARQSIRFMAFSFSHDAIGSAVLQQARAGVSVQGVFETTGSDTAHSEFGLMQREHVDVLQDGNPYILHHKVFIIDDAIVVAGSFNFSNNADTSNDENLLIIYNRAIAAAFLQEFNRVYQDAQRS